MYVYPPQKKTEHKLSQYQVRGRTGVPAAGSRSRGLRNERYLYNHCIGTVYNYCI